jgi:hypothetical protein
MNLAQAIVNGVSWSVFLFRVFLSARIFDNSCVQTVVVTKREFWTPSTVAVGKQFSIQCADCILLKKVNRQDGAVCLKDDLQPI